METTLELTNIERYYAAQVASSAARTFGEDVEPCRLHVLANEAVVALVRDGGRLTAFVPELALRALRESLAA